MDFGDAIKQLKKGENLTRKGWNGTNMYITLQTPTNDSKMTLPYIYMKTTTNDYVPWTASQTDILSVDWEIYNNK